MEPIITTLTSHKALLLIAVLISIVIILSHIKKLAKAALVICAIIVVYIAYLVYSGQRVPTTKKETIEHVTDKIDVLKKDGGNVLKGGK